MWFGDLIVYTDADAETFPRGGECSRSWTASTCRPRYVYRPRTVVGSSMSRATFCGRRSRPSDWSCWTTGTTATS